MQIENGIAHNEEDYLNNVKGEKNSLVIVELKRKRVSVMSFRWS